LLQSNTNLQISLQIYKISKSVNIERVDLAGLIYIGCFSQGDTFEKALKNIQEAIDLYLENEELPKAPVKEFIGPLEVCY